MGSRKQQRGRLLWDGRKEKTGCVGKRTRARDLCLYSREGGKVILAGWVGVGRKVGLRTVVKV